MDITWRMPEIQDGMRRSKVGPCVVTLGSGEDSAKVVKAIAIVAIATASPMGLGAVTATLRELEGRRLISGDGERQLMSQFEDRGILDIDYWGGTAVKLALWRQEDGSFAISVNSWTDRQDGCDLQAAVDELEQVLQAVKNIPTP